MTSTLLTADVGNTAAKLRAWVLEEQGPLRCVARCDLPSRGGDGSAERDLEQFLASAPRADFAALSSVVEPDLGRLWQDRISAPSRLPADWNLDPGLENRTREPARVGRDRLFAARGALELAESSCVVVNVGTAMTVDAVLDLERAQAGAARSGTHGAEGLGWRRGAFLGGAIAPGPWMMARALGAGAAQLFAVDPEADPPALGLDSEQAMRAGVGLGLRGAARELVNEVGRAAHFVDPTVVLAGGARHFVLRAFEQRRATQCPDLVHLGLCAAVLESAGRPRPPAFGLP